MPVAGHFKLAVLAGGAVRASRGSFSSGVRSMVPGRRSWSVDAEREDGVLGDGSSVLVGLLWG